MLRPGLPWGPPPPPAQARAEAGAKYLSDSVENATPAELTNMLFIEVIRAIDTAIELFHNDKHPDAVSHIIKAQQIVVEFRTSLNPDAGDIALTLDSVYAWAYHNLVIASPNRDVKALAEARSCLAELGEAWAVIATGAPAR